MNALQKTVATALLLLVRAYQIALAPHFGGQCRFVPGCSEYAAQALQQHPPGAALRLAARRLLRCHPFSRSCGFDPPPTLSTAKTRAAVPRRQTGLKLGP